MRTVLMAAIIAAATPQFRSPAVNRAKGEYDKAVAKAKAEYDKAVAAAGEKYTRVLHAEMLKATQAGELDNALAYRKEKERVMAAQGGGDLRLNGTWIVEDDNRRLPRLPQWLFFSGDRVAYGYVAAKSLTGRVTRSGDGYAIPFDDGTTVLVRLHAGGLEYAHFSSDTAMRSSLPVRRGEGRRLADVLSGQK